MAPAAPCTALHRLLLTSSSLFIEIFSLYNLIFPPQLLEKEVPGHNTSSSSHQHSHTRLLWHVTVFNPPDPGHVAGDTRHAGHALRSSQQWQWEVRGGGGDDASHYKICGMISSLMESEPTIRHGHQLICLMKVD